VPDTFNTQWTEQTAWRRDFSFLLKLLSRWLKDNGLMEAGVQTSIQRLAHRAQASKVMVAFVAEFSRGKSEMVNALFFAGYGRRIMPANAGRTTMCPAEIGYDRQSAPTLRLLPIETRLQPQALNDWRDKPEAWTTFELDVHSAEQLASMLERLTDTVHVTPHQAQLLGFWHRQTPADNPSVDAQGLVEVPKWRHALVNCPHPLLEQGLVILDTPGLNAIGAEPELTLDLIDQADAVVFIVGADTGVTGSDLAIWQDHLRPGADAGRTKLVVLNKIDTLWDELRSPNQVQAQIEAQKRHAAQALRLEPTEVLAVSAQKGLVAKISGNSDLLEQSGLLQLEAALAQGIVGGRRAVLRAAIAEDLATLHAEVERLIALRRGDLATQTAEVDGLRGKSEAVLHQLRKHIGQEQQDFERATLQMRAVKVVHIRLFQGVWEALDPRSLALEMVELGQTLAQPGLKLGAKRVYGELFHRLRVRLQRVQATADEIREMQGATFGQIRAQWGLALQPIAPPSLDACMMELYLTEQSHLSYLGLRNLLRLQQPEFTQRMVSALSSRLATIHARVRMDAEQWRNAVDALLEGEIRLRRSHFANRLAPLDAIGNATEGLEQRLLRIAEQQQTLESLALKFKEQAAYLAAANQDHQDHKMRADQGAGLQIPSRVSIHP